MQNKNNTLTVDEALILPIGTTHVSSNYINNGKIYEAIKHLGKVTRQGDSYACSKYTVTETTDIKLTTVQKALIADGGNLCFGYRTEGDIIVIYTD